MELWHAVLLGLVEGITEYLPISSTGHLVITSELLGLGRGSEHAKRALDDFNIVIQGGAILAVLGLYFPRFVQMIRGLLGRDRAGLRLWINLVIAFLPAAAVGFLAHDWIEARLFAIWPVTLALVLGGIYMILMDRRLRPGQARSLDANEGQTGVQSANASQPSTLDLEHLTPRHAVMIGLLQCFALWPGVSRSMMTITGGYFAGLKPKAAAEFSFLLGMPTLLAASGYSLLKNLMHARKTGEPNLFQTIGVTPCLVGVLVAAVSATLAVRWLVGFLNRNGLAPFGYYRIALAIVLVGLWLAGRVAFGPG